MCHFFLRGAIYIFGFLRYYHIILKFERSFGTGENSSSHLDLTDRYQRSIGRNTRYKKPCYPTSRDTVYKLDTASNPSSPPQIKNKGPSFIIDLTRDRKWCPLWFSMQWSKFYVVGRVQACKTVEGKVPYTCVWPTIHGR